LEPPKNYKNNISPLTRDNAHGNDSFIISEGGSTNVGPGPIPDHYIVPISKNLRKSDKDSLGPSSFINGQIGQSNRPLVSDRYYQGPSSFKED
jgi:hypothetical protein